MIKKKLSVVQNRGSDYYGRQTYSVMVEINRPRDLLLGMKCTSLLARFNSVSVSGTTNGLAFFVAIKQHITCMKNSDA